MSDQTKIICPKCGNDKFHIRITKAGEVASYTDFYCTECGEHEGGFINDPLNEIEENPNG